MRNKSEPTYEKMASWQKGMSLVKCVYDLTRTFPKSETFGLSSQMQRCAVSIPSNIAEGYRRGTKNEFNHFLKFAYGSGAELETQLKIAKMLGYGNEKLYADAEELLDEVMRLLSTMVKNHRSPMV